MEERCHRRLRSSDDEPLSSAIPPSPSTSKRQRPQLDEDSSTDFVPIFSQFAKPTVLTGHQKEKLQTRSYVPALHNDLSQDSVSRPSFPAFFLDGSNSGGTDSTSQDARDDATERTTDVRVVLNRLSDNDLSHYSRVCNLASSSDGFQVDYNTGEVIDNEAMAEQQEGGSTSGEDSETVHRNTQNDLDSAVVKQRRQHIKPARFSDFIDTTQSRKYSNKKGKSADDSQPPSSEENSCDVSTASAVTEDRTEENQVQRSERERHPRKSIPKKLTPRLRLGLSRRRRPQIVVEENVINQDPENDSVNDVSSEDPSIERPRSSTPESELETDVREPEISEDRSEYVPENTETQDSDGPITFEKLRQMECDTIETAEELENQDPGEEESVQEKIVSQQRDYSRRWNRRPSVIQNEGTGFDLPKELPPLSSSLARQMVSERSERMVQQARIRRRKRVLPGVVRTGLRSQTKDVIPEEPPGPKKWLYPDMLPVPKRRHYKKKPTPPATEEATEQSETVTEKATEEPIRDEGTPQSNAQEYGENEEVQLGMVEQTVTSPQSPSKRGRPRKRVESSIALPDAEIVLTQSDRASAPLLVLHSDGNVSALGEASAMKKTRRKRSSALFGLKPTRSSERIRRYTEQRGPVEEDSQEALAVRLPPPFVNIRGGLSNVSTSNRGNKVNQGGRGGTGMGRGARGRGGRRRRKGHGWFQCPSRKRQNTFDRYMARVRVTTPSPTLISLLTPTIPLLQVRQPTPVAQKSIWISVLDSPEKRAQAVARARPQPSSPIRDWLRSPERQEQTSKVNVEQPVESSTVTKNNKEHAPPEVIDISTPPRKALEATRGRQLRSDGGPQDIPVDALPRELSPLRKRAAPLRRERSPVRRRLLTEAGPSKEPDEALPSGRANTDRTDEWLREAAQLCRISLSLQQQQREAALAAHNKPVSITPDELMSLIDHAERTLTPSESTAVARTDDWDTSGSESTEPREGPSDANVSPASDSPRNETGSETSDANINLSDSERNASEDLITEVTIPAESSPQRTNTLTDAGDVPSPPISGFTRRIADNSWSPAFTQRNRPGSPLPTGARRAGRQLAISPPHRQQTDTLPAMSPPLARRMCNMRTESIMQAAQKRNGETKPSRQQLIQRRSEPGLLASGTNHGELRGILRGAGAEQRRRMQVSFAVPLAVQLVTTDFPGCRGHTYPVHYHSDEDSKPISQQEVIARVNKICWEMCSTNRGRREASKENENRTNVESSEPEDDPVYLSEQGPTEAASVGENVAQAEPQQSASDFVQLHGSSATSSECASVAEASDVQVPQSGEMASAASASAVSPMSTASNGFHPSEGASIPTHPAKRKWNNSLSMRGNKVRRSGDGISSNTEPSKGQVMESIVQNQTTVRSTSTETTREETNGELPQETATADVSIPAVLRNPVPDTCRHFITDIIDELAGTYMRERVLSHLERINIHTIRDLGRITMDELNRLEISYPQQQVLEAVLASHAAVCQPVAVIPPPPPLAPRPGIYNTLPHPTNQPADNVPLPPPPPVTTANFKEFVLVLREDLQRAVVTCDQFLLSNQPSTSNA